MRDVVFATLSAVGLYFLVIGGFQLLERMIPAERNQPWRNLLFSAACTLGFLLLRPLVAAATLWSAGILRPSLISIDLRTWTTGYPPIDWPLSNLLLPLIPFLVFDFFYYWHHRFQHIIPAFWEQHKLHHAEESLNSLTNLRHHWLEDLVRIVTITLPMGLLVQITPIQGALILIATAHWSIFFHANLRLPFGPITPIITGLSITASITPSWRSIATGTSPPSFRSGICCSRPITDHEPANGRPPACTTVSG
jgi:sterol desaturase/sphingolipid hydroxylase (fatty acid hydroxylase superfamily)